MGIDVSKYKGFKNPLPTKGKYLGKIVKVKTTEGTGEDENGEISQGFLVEYVLTGPDNAMMTDGGSALGFKVSERVWVPRQSWRDSDPASANRQDARVATRLAAWFGSEDAIPEGEVDNSELEACEDRLVDLVLSSEYSDYDGVDVSVVKQVKAHVEAEE